MDASISPPRRRNRLDSWIGKAADLGFRALASRRVAAVRAADPVAAQERELQKLVTSACGTRFGRAHGFQRVRSVADYQAAVPIRTYEQLWNDYLEPAYPVLENITWPGLIPFFALTSGTTQGATKYIPVSREMIASNAKAAITMLAFHADQKPRSSLFSGKLFFLGGSTNLETPGGGVRQGDLSGIAADQLNPLLRRFTFPPLELALEPNWDFKLDRLAESSIAEPITLLGGVPSWLLVLCHKIFRLTGCSTLAEVWPSLELVVHGGVKFDPYEDAFANILGPGVRLQETYPCSEGFVAFGDPSTRLLRPVLDHGVFYEFIPVEELDSPAPTRHWIKTAEPGRHYAIVVSTCAGMWSHLIGDTIRFESLDPPLFTFTGRTKYTLSAFGEHLISEEIEAAIASAAKASGAIARDWHAGPVFSGSLGHHLFIVEFQAPPADAAAFRSALDADLRARNADYHAHRDDRVGLPLPRLVISGPGGFDDWMRSRGKLGGQHKVPRMDNSGMLTRELLAFLERTGKLINELPAGPAAEAPAFEKAAAGR